MAIEVSASDLREALNRVVRDCLPLATISLTVLYTFFAIVHWLVQAKPVGLALSISAAASAVVLVALFIILKRWAIPLDSVHAFAAALAMVPLFNSFITLYLLSEPQQTTNFMLVIIGAGLFFLSTPWLALVIAVTFLSWLFVVWQAPPSPSWVHFGFAMISATVISFFTHSVRLRILRRVEGLRILDE